ncbi:glycoside hydrolase family 127 protein [Clostridium chromiireducens]|uniref:Glycoside hydrolase family 127 protein n=1 Tax=Clostridium chromiireducens TaxID=225345 RepID=A0A964RPM0_9CLOT|nr:beta-L-arabinofuranosidase domain-containing protein [Clostridium chromiireducens]MVX65492.1 glycoside hydrolase family 127 protein [Clostridium chromiireducens]
MDKDSLEFSKDLRKISKEIPLNNIKINDEFWSKYIKLAMEVVIPYQWEAINDRIEDAEPSHAIKNFRIAAGLETGEFHGMVFQDSDVSKWLEAVGFSLQTHPDSELEKNADEVIDILELAQRPDGYLNTYFILKEPKNRWTNLAECHELYCAGHFFEAAVAYYNATNKRKVLDIACRFADYIDATFGPEEGKIHGYDGHPEVELALFKLYKVTENKKYLKLSKYFLDERGAKPDFFDMQWEKRGRKGFWQGGINREWGKKYYQTHLPIRKQSTAEGHAVRVVYMCMGMADVAAETGDSELFKTCKNLWNNIVSKRMYITGGIGSTSIGEAFTFDYDLSNDTVYAETCASIGLAFFAQRMLIIEPRSEYADIMERALYNTIIGGMSQDGKGFFYVNPLEVRPEACEKNPTKHHVKPVRQKWFTCACCPPNITRTLTSLGRYIYTVNDDAVYANLYIGGKADINVGNNEIRLIQETEYPWEEKVLIKVGAKEKTKFTLALRIPGWCGKAEVKVNSEVINIEEIKLNGYAMVNREWRDGDKVELILKMPILRMKANPLVSDDIGKVAIQRGPLVYCLEEADNGSNLHEIYLPKEAELEECFEADLLGGVMVLKAEAKRISNNSKWKDQLYSSEIKEEYDSINIKFVPYYSWANRGTGEMIVWVREK